MFSLSKKPLSIFSNFCNNFAASPSLKTVLVSGLHKIANNNLNLPIEESICRGQDQQDGSHLGLQEKLKYTCTSSSPVHCIL